MHTRIRTALFLAFLYGLTACGFQLRGTQPDYLAGVSSIRIRDAGAYDVGEVLRTQLTLSGINITDSETDADYTVRVFDRSINQTILSVSAITGKVEEYQVSYSVRVSVTDRENNERLSNQLIRVSRDYAFDDRAVLGSESERRLLIDEMTKQAASQIIRRLDILTR